MASAVSNKWYPPTCSLDDISNGTCKNKHSSPRQREEGFFDVNKFYIQVKGAGLETLRITYSYYQRGTCPHKKRHAWDYHGKMDLKVPDSDRTSLRIYFLAAKEFQIPPVQCNCEK